MRIDLHVHTDASDGTDTPEELVRRASGLGLDVIGLTDHDTTAGHAPALAAARQAGIVVLPGVEISCVDAGVNLHLLGYLFDVDEPALAAELERLRTDRLRRAKAMVERLVELGAPISWAQVAGIAGDAAVGRPHVARALVAAGVLADVPAAFTPEWIGDGGRAYVEKYAPAPQRAIELVHAAGGVCVFAHPAAASRGPIVTFERIGELAAAGLDGLEVDHPDHDEPTRRRLRGLAADLGLLITGSSDYHGFVKQVELGANTTAPEVLAALRSRASGRASVLP